MIEIGPPEGMVLPQRKLKLALLDLLADRETLILPKPIVAILREKTFFQTPEEIEVIEKYWGEKLARGLIDRMIAEAEKMGYKIPAKTREGLVKAWARVVSEGLIR